ncbi:hypothetical protein F9047_10645 [Escherichia coli]|nr:hypothetical protein F9047_10645 [Escherichia coli]
MAIRTGRRRRSRKPSFTAKVKATTPIRVPLSKDKWVSGSKSIAAYRDQLLLEQGGLCAILREPMADPCLDHDHYDGKCRGVIGSTLNLFEGGVQKLWSKHMEGKTGLTMSETLRRLADYLERDYLHHKFHGEIVADLKKSLKRWTKETIARNAYLNFGIVIDENLDKGVMITIYVTEFVRKLEEDYLYE